jgi:hypothetical protein
METRAVMKTTTQDIEAYQIRRDRFLDAQILFKTGFVEHGVLALNYLQQMFYILPAGRYIVKDEKKAQEFVDEIDELRKFMVTYIKKKDAVPNKNYLEFADFNDLDNRFDSVVLRFYKILYEVGFSP